MQVCETHLHILSLDRTASFDDIREAYQDLVLVWHPDRFMGNPRLYKKAEEKLKQVNQAYAYLKSWHNHLRPSATSKSNRSTSPACPAKDQVPVANATKQTSTRPPSSTPRASKLPLARGISCPWLSLADAEFIFCHYQFKLTPHGDASYQTYHSGPFLLVTCDHPQAITLSVPCDSVQEFDRILLSIPCKSMGHFDLEEAEHLLTLLQIQEA